ncbi:MAG TPA: PBP1A family penicillin-binding protein, partial [Myxococcales bacterium]|nr:PBP1A family penicillin-binding protein [Myxococcales bacterium]
DPSSDGDSPANDGATSFLRVPVQREPAPAPNAAEEVPGATVVVRAGAPLPPPRRAPEPLAPRKGLQVRLPDDEPAPPPRPKRPVLQPPSEDAKGRRGAWWDEKAAPIPDEEEPHVAPAPPAKPSSDDEKGATAFLRVRPPPPAPPPPEPIEPEVEPYRPVRADDYGGDVTVQKPRWMIWLRRAAWTCAALLLFGIAALVGGYLYLAREIPTFDTVKDYRPMLSTKVVAQDGTVVGQFYQERRTLVAMDKIPRVLVQAVISAEDKDFYKHPGFNPFSLARAAVVDALSGEKRLGASTITQQVVKNFFLGNEKRWRRKLKEILLSLRLEKNLSKDDILFLYLNQINFGRAHYGVEEASLYYFNKHVWDIGLGEAAILAGLPQNPARINPRRHPDRAKRRQIYVLDRMLANHYISQAEHDAEVEKPIVLPPVPPDPPGGWYLEETRRQLVAQLGETAVETTGMTVEVGMDPRLQAAAEQAVREGLRAVDKRQGWRGAAVKVDAAALDDYRAALARRYAQLTATGDQLEVFDLEGISSKEAARPDIFARVARTRPLEQNEIYGALVTAVSAREARVELAPGVQGTVPFSTMSWAREFKPEHATPPPRSALEVLAPGDVVEVRVLRASTTRVAENRLRVTRLELALEQTPAVQGAFVAIDLRTRAVLALVGGYDAALSSFNRATQAKRQPGSAFKPFLYAAALESGKYTPVTILDDSPEVIVDPWTGKPWKPQNFEKDEFNGPMTLRKALAESKNTVAVKLLLGVGLDKVRAEAVAAGLTSEIPQSYTAALGTGETYVIELINAYATIATQGRKADPILIRRIVSRTGATIQAVQADPQQTMRPDVAYLTADMMRSVIDDPEGTAHSLSALGRPIAGKTGTANEHRDGWFIGFTPSLIAGAWVGFDDHRMMGSYETGGHCAGPIWLSWMRAATSGTEVEEWPAPAPGVSCLKINRTSGALAGDNDPFAVRECFLAGTEPTQQHVDAPAPTPDDFYQERR